MTRHDAVFPIGALAEAAGVSTPTIRYYEDIALIPPHVAVPRGTAITRGRMSIG